MFANAKRLAQAGASLAHQEQLQRPGCLDPDAPCNGASFQYHSGREAVSESLDFPSARVSEPNDEMRGLTPFTWSFDISTPKSKNITEIMVDAKTGKVISSKVETPKDQNAESAADKAEAAGKKGR